VRVFCFKKSFGGLKKSRIFVIVKKEIIYTEHYVLIVSELTSTGKEGQVFLTKENTIHTVIGWNYGDRVIIAHRPLTDAPILEGVPLLPIIKNEIQLNIYPHINDKAKNNIIDLNAYGNGCIDGYNKAKETYKYTEDDLIAFSNFVTTNLMHHSDSNGFYIGVRKVLELFKNIQQPKRPKYFDCEIEYIHDETVPYPKTLGTKPKTITNSQGQVELVGEYV
jgi:hypothetical protein